MCTCLCVCQFACALHVQFTSNLHYWDYFSANQPGAYDHIIVNDDVEVAYEKLKGILIAVSMTMFTSNTVEPFMKDHPKSQRVV